MENLALATPKPVLGLGYSPHPKNIATKQPFGLPLRLRKATKFLSSNTKTRIFVSATNSSSGESGRIAGSEKDNKLGVELFASISKGGRQTTSVGVNPPVSAPPPSSQFGSPLFWIGVGVAASALFSFVASNVKKYAMQQALKTMMGQMGSQNTQFNNPEFPSRPNFPFPPQGAAWPASPSVVTSSSGPTSGAWTTSSQGKSFSPAPASSPKTSASTAPRPTTTADPASSSFLDSRDPAPADASASKSGSSQAVDNEETKSDTKKYAFVDVSPEETLQKSPFENFEDSSTETQARDTKFAEVVTDNGAASQAGYGWSEGTQSQNPGGGIPVDALEKMLEDPTVQKMVYPYLPEEMRNPETFKWMLQNPQLRQQLEDMINNPGSNPAWDSRMTDTLKNFDLSSPEVKQQFDQIGMTPEEVISKIMSNPEVAMAFQNPRVQSAIMDCSQNPMNIMKYQNDKEVMDVFNKLQDLFPGMTG